MKCAWILPVLLCLGLGGFIAPVAAADDKPVVAMIGTGTLASTFGPAVGRAGYPVVYGSRDPARRRSDWSWTPVRRSRSASFRTSEATTANPRPYSPAFSALRPDSRALSADSHGVGQGVGARVASSEPS